MKHCNPAHFFDVGVHAECLIKDNTKISGCVNSCDLMTDCNMVYVATDALLRCSNK